MNTLVVGDLHGKIEIAKELLQDLNQSIIFIGDYLDSFDRTIKDQVDLLAMVLDALDNRSNVIALMGNHELSYLNPLYRASGYHIETDVAILPMKAKMIMQLALFTESNGFLLTHAGVSQNWLAKDIKDIPEYLETIPISNIFDIGYAREGCVPCGGPLWCDWYEEFKPVEGISQICGHTARRPTEKKGILSYYDGNNVNYNIDCLDWTKEVLELSNNTAKILKL